MALTRPAPTRPALGDRARSWWDALVAALARVEVQLGLVIALGVVMRLYRFTAPILDQHLFRQTQTASSVVLFDRFGFDPFNYHVPMYGGGYAVYEFPWYQIIVWVMAQVAGFHEYLGRLVSIASFVVAAIVLFAIARRLFGSRNAALASVAFFAFMPIDVFYFRAFMIDPFLVMTALIWIYASLRLVEAFSWRWCAVWSVALFLTALGKASFLVIFGLPVLILFVRVVRDRTTPVAGWVAMIGASALTLILLILWLRHADQLNISSTGESFSDDSSWYFGSRFFDTGLWVTVVQRFVGQLGVVGVVLFGIGVGSIATLRTRYRPELVALLVGNIASIAIFANLNFQHDYYQLPYYVTLSLMGGLGLWSVAHAARAVSWRFARQVTAGLLIALGVSWGLELMAGYYGPQALALAYRDGGAEVRAHTPDRRIVVLNDVDAPGTPMLLYEAGRIGWTIPRVNGNEVADRLDRSPDVAAIAVQPGTAVPPYLPPLARAKGFRLTYQSPSLAVFTRAAR